VKSRLAVRLSWAPYRGRVSCAWGGGPPGGQLALGTDVGRRKNGAWRRQHSAASCFSRAAKGIISGSKPAILRRWVQACRLVCSMQHDTRAYRWGVAGGRGWCILSKDPTAPALIARSGADGGQPVVGAGVSERVEEWESEVVLLRYDMLPQFTLCEPITPNHESEGLHRVRARHLLRGRACSRQTKLLAHGCPSAIWGGPCIASVIGLFVAERLPEIGMRPPSLSSTACNGTREPTTWGFAGGCSIRHCDHH
jgi:hypothetical protein